MRKLTLLGYLGSWAQHKIKCEFSATFPFVPGFSCTVSRITQPKTEYRKHKGRTRKSFGTQGTVAKKVPLKLRLLCATRPWD